MAKSKEDLVIGIDGDNSDFKDELVDSTKESKKFGDTLDNSLNKSNKSSKELGKAIEGSMISANIKAELLTRGLDTMVGVFKDSVTSFVDFEAGFTDVLTLLDEKTAIDNVEQLRAGILQLGADSGQSFEKLNKGLFDIISSGVSAADSIKVLETATKLATAGSTDVSIAVDGMTTAIGAFGLEASDAESVAAKFFTAQKFGKTTVAELAQSFGLAGATAAAYNVDINELLGATSAATLAGIDTSAAFTGLKAIFAGISKPTKEAADEADKLGIKFDTTALRAKGLTGFLGSLTEAQGFTKQSIEKLFGSVEAQNILFALTGEQAQDFADITKSLGSEQDNAAIFADALAVKQKSVGFQMDQAKQSVELLKIELGEGLVPTVLEVTNVLTENSENIIALVETVGTTVSFFGSLFNGLVQILKGNLREQRDLLDKFREENEADAAFHKKLLDDRNLSEENFLENAKERQKLLLAFLKGSNHDQEDAQIEHEKKKKKIAEASAEQLEKIEEESLQRLLTLQERELELQRLALIGASKEAIKIRTDQFRSLEKIDRLEKKSEELRQKTSLTKIERAQLRHIRKLIDLEKEKFETLEAAQDEAFNGPGGLLDDLEDGLDDSLELYEDFIEEVNDLPTAEVNVEVEDPPIIDSDSGGTGGGGTNGGGGDTSGGGTSGGGGADDPDDPVPTEPDIFGPIANKRPAGLGPCTLGSDKLVDPNGKQWCVSRCASGIRTYDSAQGQWVCKTPVTNPSSSGADSAGSTDDDTEFFFEPLVKNVGDAATDIGKTIISSLPFGSASGPILEAGAGGTAGRAAPQRTAPQKIIVDIQLKGELVNFIDAEQRKARDLGVSEQ